MGFRILKNEKTQRSSTPRCTVNFSLKRINFNKPAIALLAHHYGSDSDFMQILLNDEQPDKFWVKYTQAEADGARKMYKASSGTKTCNISLLLIELNWNLEETCRLAVTWDDDANAARIEIQRGEKGD